MTTKPFKAVATCAAIAGLLTGSATFALRSDAAGIEGKAAAGVQAIDWQPWSDSVFAQAREQGRFVLLDLGTVWCHWCHVMDEVTYQDPKVIELIRSHYVAVRTDADSRPELSNLYEDYGWPATIVFGPDKDEIVKRRGYMPPRQMESMLRAIISDPTPGPSALPEAALTPGNGTVENSEMRNTLRQVLIDAYDHDNQGWGTVQKWLDWDILEYCMAETWRGDKGLESMARETLAAQLNLMDPVWGGVYQYSTDGDWQHPHFEKIMQMQAEDLRIYAAAYRLWRDESYLQAAKKIASYLKSFLSSPEGAFYTSQDADLVPGEHSGEYFQLSDAMRRQRGLPRIDTHIYARENGWAINALATLYAATGEQRYLNDAIHAANWVVDHRAIPGGGFHHDEMDSGGPYLGDTLYMGRAFLTLYTVTADRAWLQRAEEAVRFISANFNTDAGYLTSAGAGPLKWKPQVDENVTVTRLANLLYHYSGQAEYTRIAEHAMRFLATPGVADRRGFLVGGILLADSELRAAPVHIVIVGHKSDPTARVLFAAALRQPVTYKSVEWWDRSEGPLPNPEVEYPDLGQAAAFLCADGSCSSPIFSPDRMSNLVGGSSRRAQK
jgi:uncharacterized protein YyaL (SSP411 family)